MITLEDVQRLVDEHGPVMAPGWEIRTALHDFEDWHPALGDGWTDHGRGDIERHRTRLYAWMRVDPRTEPDALEEVVVHELAHLVLHDYQQFTCDRIDRRDEQAEIDVSERATWAIADLYLRARRRTPCDTSPS